LNPLFVEALMGWPIGWSDFGSWGTAWSLLRELSQS
jgi:DNA (cytosine-5)-methyltransferase 1